MDSNEILDADLDGDDYRMEIELMPQNNFILLFILSLGLYSIWWMYKLWKFFKEKERMDIWPVPRAIFAIFFIYYLFEKILLLAQARGYAKDYSPGLLFGGYFVLNALSRIDYLWMASLLTVIVFIPPLNAYNFAMENSDTFRSKINKGFNARQVIVLILGGLIWALILLGLVIPTE